jgi:hypothetical protein
VLTFGVLNPDIHGLNRTSSEGSPIEGGLVADLKRNTTSALPQPPFEQTLEVL